MDFKKHVKSAIGLVLAAVMTVTITACTSTGTSTSAAPAATKAASTSSTITLVWYPNESAADYAPAREEYARLITQATGKKVEQKLTTDYAIAIEAIASGTAQISFMGAQGYIEANNKSKDVKPLFVNAGASGTLSDAIYYSWLAINKGQESAYMENGKYAITNIQGKKMSFVSNSSTSGFKVPTNSIITEFKKTDKWKSINTDALIEGGKDKFFSQVLFGGSHQGSAVNLLTGKADVAAFCDTEAAPYMKVASGAESAVGSVYEVKTGASAPFDTLIGKQCVIIKSTPVLNGPFAYNSKTLSADDVKKIQDLFTSAEVASNPKMFVIKGSGNVGLFAKTKNEKFVLVDDSWYNPIRQMS
jgi:phosphonate transport system substrate-binding protein